MDVYVVDYGDSTYLNLTDIRVLAHQFYDYPLQAIECHLHDVMLNDKYDDWSDEAIYYFEEITYSCKWKPITLQLVEFDNKVPVVKLFDQVKLKSKDLTF